MSKVYVIDKCSECPNLSLDYTACVIEFTIHGMPDDIPEWCPLPEGPEPYSLRCPTCGEKRDNKTKEVSKDCIDAKAMNNRRKPYLGYVWSYFDPKNCR